jgi:soluble lytic murein transglycosylase
LVAGLLLAERQPTEAIRLLKAAQQELPVLEDYIRFWIADALLKNGDTQQAAALLESVPETAPETLLLNRVAYRAGETWYKAGQCRKAMEWLSRAVGRGPQDTAAPSALLNLADCQMRDSRSADAVTALRQIWAQYPQSLEAREAEIRLARSAAGGIWRPAPDDLYARTLSFLTLSLYEEAIETIQAFLAAAPSHVRRGEVRLKLGAALVRVKRYEQARSVFQELVEERVAESGDAAVWLARVYLRQGDGERLASLPQSLTRAPLSSEQRAAIQMLVAVRHDDEEQYDQALSVYRQVVQGAESAAPRADALWRIGWIQYKTKRFSEAVETFESLINGKEDSPLAPQALYWSARALERRQDTRAAEYYLNLCRHYPFTYHCQLAQLRSRPTGLVPVAADEPPPAPAVIGSEAGRVVQDAHYRKAVELRMLGMDQDAARELAWLADHYAGDREAIAELSVLLGEAGAHHQALRLARLHFRGGLERGGESVPRSLWSVAYPIAYLPTVRTYADASVDPYLVLAIIREESQYDVRALSRVGAVGLMQMMPGTAQALAKRQGLPVVMREELYNYETNIRFGVHYLRELLQQFSGNVVYAVAAYNAGPQAVTAWIAKSNGREPDEFVELIPYQETRQYVKRVLRSYREYHRLGGNACEPSVLDKVC